MATFSTKSLHFPGGVPKKQKKKNKDFGLFRPRLRQDSFHQKLAFSWRGTQKKDFGPIRPRLRQDSKIFGFSVFLVPPQEMATFSTKSLHFPEEIPPKKTKILDSSSLAFAKTLKSLFFLVFLVPPQEMATFPGLAILPAHYCIL